MSQACFCHRVHRVSEKNLRVLCGLCGKIHNISRPSKIKDSLSAVLEMILLLNIYDQQAKILHGMRGGI
jgi:hypothetical protein